MNDLFETVVERVPPPVIEEAPFRMLVSNIDWDEYVGRMAIGRILSGDVKQGDQINVLRKDGSKQKAKIIKLKQFAGLQTNDVTSATAGDIAGLAGFDEVDIGDTLALAEDAEPLPFVEIDPATVQMEFSVNDGPLAGRDGKKVTSREIRGDSSARRSRTFPSAYTTPRRARGFSSTHGQHADRSATRDHAARGLRSACLTTDRVVP